MTNLTKCVLTSLVILSTTVAPSIGAGKEKNQSAGSSKATKYVSGTTVDFAAELELNFASLTTLGSRIEQCRTVSPDPVGLAAAAYELAVAEKVSGKKAGLTSSRLMAEAIQIAKLRYNSRELKGLLHYVKNEDTQDDLETISQQAELDEKDRSKKVRVGIAPRNTVIELTVQNDSRQSVRVYYNRRYVGQLKPKGRADFRINRHGPYQELSAYGSRGSRWQSQNDVIVGNYTWTIQHRR